MRLKNEVAVCSYSDSYTECVLRGPDSASFRWDELCSKRSGHKRAKGGFCKAEWVPDVLPTGRTFVVLPRDDFTRN